VGGGGGGVIDVARLNFKLCHVVMMSLKVNAFNSKSCIKMATTDAYTATGIVRSHERKSKP